MPSIVVIAQLIAADKDARKTIVGALDGVSKYSKQNEPGVVRYAICHPRFEPDEQSIFVIEEYSSQSALDTHMASKPVQEELIAFFGANPTLFGGAPTISTSLVSSSFVRPQLSKATDPFITFATINYKEGKRAEALEGWKKVTTETEKNESETLSYGIYADKEDVASVKTIEVYASENYFKEVHAASKAVTENKEKYGDDYRVSLKHYFLELVGGYLSREKVGSCL